MSSSYLIFTNRGDCEERNMQFAQSVGAGIGLTDVTKFMFNVVQHAWDNTLFALEVLQEYEYLLTEEEQLSLVATLPSTWFPIRYPRVSDQIYLDPYILGVVDLNPTVIYDGLARFTVSFRYVGSPAATEYGIVYGSSPYDLYLGAPLTSSQAGTGTISVGPNFNVNVLLEANQDFYAVAYIKSSVGVNYSNVVQFRTELTSDVTPNPTPNWANIQYNGFSGTYTTAVQQIQGINAPITLEVTRSGGGGIIIYRRVDNSAPYWSNGGTEWDGNTTGWTMINSYPYTFSVANNQYVSFACGPANNFDSTGTITVKNISDGSVTLDTFIADVIVGVV